MLGRLKTTGGRQVPSFFTGLDLFWILVFSFIALNTSADNFLNVDTSKTKISFHLNLSAMSFPKLKGVDVEYPGLIHPTTSFGAGYSLFGISYEIPKYKLGFALQGGHESDEVYSRRLWITEESKSFYEFGYVPYTRAFMFRERFAPIRRGYISVEATKFRYIGDFKFSFGLFVGLDDRTWDFRYESSVYPWVIKGESGARRNLYSWGTHVGLRYKRIELNYKLKLFTEEMNYTFYNIDEDALNFSISDTYTNRQYFHIVGIRYYVWERSK